MVIQVILETIGPVKCNSNYFANIIFNNGNGNCKVYGNGGNRKLIRNCNGNGHLHIRFQRHIEHKASAFLSIIHLLLFERLMP